MQKFRFGMQKLLELRTRERDQQASLYRQSVREINLCEQRKNALEREHSGLGKITTGSGTKIDPQHMMDVERYRTYLQLELQTTSQLTKELTGKAESQRVSLLEAEKQVEVLKRLRAKKWNAWQQAHSKQMQAELDDYAANHRLGIECSLTR